MPGSKPPRSSSTSPTKGSASSRAILSLSAGIIRGGSSVRRTTSMQATSMAAGSRPASLAAAAISRTA